MLKELQLINFKSINIEKPLKFGEYTVLCGSNSSGKSSLIQSILMLCQTMGSRYQSDEVVLNGHMIRLGSYNDIKKHASGNEDVGIHFVLEFPVGGNKNFYICKIACAITFGHKNNSGEDDDIFHPRIFKAEYRVTSLINEQEIEHVLIVSQENENESGEGLYCIESYESNERYTIDKNFPNNKIIGAIKSGIFPSVISLEYDKTKKISQHVINMLIDEIQRGRRGFDIDSYEDLLLTQTFVEELKSVIRLERKNLTKTIKVPDDIIRILKDKNLDVKKYEKEIKLKMVDASFPIKESIISSEILKNDDATIGDWLGFVRTLNSEDKKALNELIDKYRSELQEAWYNGQQIETKKEQYVSMVFSQAKDLLTSYFLRSVKYLGPLRNEPQAIYSSLGLNDPNYVGLKGENTAAVLHLNKDKSVTYFSPNETDGVFSFSEKNCSLKEACQDWLSYLGVVSDFDTKDRGKLGYELYVKTFSIDEKWQDLTHVGVGVSQVLPIVLMFLLSAKDDLLIFEQPELHLHPKVQSRLCDLFRVMAAAKRQCLIETHSEYIINRIRLRTAQQDDDNAPVGASVFFVVKLEGGSKFEEVKINRYGAVVNWPKDFFDQTDKEIEKILIEASNKKRKEIKNYAGRT